MGLLRFLLACAVVLGHAPGWGMVPDIISKGFIPPYYAVQAFFVISGFYMALIHEKYAGHKMVFYINRYSRLIVSYWIVAAVTFAASQYIDFPQYRGGAPIIPLVANLTLFGADSIQFLNQVGWILVPQGWSLGTEIWFYLLVPFIAPRKRVILILLVASLLIRTVIVNSELPFFPWQQRFFPAELMFFLIGMLSFRFKNDLGRWVVIMGVLLVIFGGHWITRYGVWISLALAAVLFVILPSVFAATKDSKADRLIGEFCYPIYLWHVFLGTSLVSAQILSNAWYLLLLTILFSIPLVFLIEKPMENWRQKRLALHSSNSATT